MPLQEYRRKRSANTTPEPFGRSNQGDLNAEGGIFVIQQHHARRMHFDFRLEMEGVLRSWAVPRGPSLNPADKRMAVMVEDHPIDYGNFEGIIPEGNYGAGSVIVWDRGTYTMIDPNEGDVVSAVHKGKLDLALHGFKLRGAFTLVRTGPRGVTRAQEKQQWLLIKKRDEYVEEDDVTVKHPASVLSGLSVDEITSASAASAQVIGKLTELSAKVVQEPLDKRQFPLMLAKPEDKPYEGDRWVYELKYDGVRALAIRDGEAVRLFARSGTDITARYPEVTLAFNTLPYDRFVMDGEIVALDDNGHPKFQLLQRRMHVQDSREVARLSFTIPVCHFLFDLLAFDRFDLRALPLEQRKELLSHLIHSEGPLRYCDHVVGQGQAFYDAVQAAGLEGTIGKLRSSPYVGRRNGDWLKIKCPIKRKFVIGGYTDPAGTRLHFGALLLGMFEENGELRFTEKVGTGFDYERLRDLHTQLEARARADSPFRKMEVNEPQLPRAGIHFVEPQMVCEVKFSEWTDAGGIRAPSFIKLLPETDPRECRYDGPGSLEEVPAAAPVVASDSTSNGRALDDRKVVTTHPDKILWPNDKFTKRDMVEYYRAIAKWMLPYLVDRPAVLVRYPDGIAGKNFFQKNAPTFVPKWIKTERIYSEDGETDFFVIESEEALAYVANLAAVVIHIWSSRITHLERPDWLLFDIDPKGSTTRQAVLVAKETAQVLKEIGLRSYIKTSGQMGLHVVVGLKPQYTYDQALMFSELVARLVVSRVPEQATIDRNPRNRNGKVYIDYLQLGHGKTIAATFSIRAQDGAPVSAPMKWNEVKPNLNPAIYNIRTIVTRMEQLREDPFIGALQDQQVLEQALPTLERMVTRAVAT